MSGENELLDAFRAAALSVTKLYKTSAATQSKSRADGYHECLEDILSFLDKEGLGTVEGEASKIRRWVLERVDGRETASQTLESEDETDKPEIASPQAHRSSSVPQPSAPRNEVHMKDSSAPPTLPAAQAVSPIVEDSDFVVPTAETFTFQPPQDAYMNLANLDLSDSQTHNSSNRAPSSTTPRSARGRNTRTGTRTASGRVVAGQKRKAVNLTEIFDLGSLGNGKDVFGGGGKRSRFA